MKFYKRIIGEEDKLDAFINFLPGLIVLQMKVGTFFDYGTKEEKTAYIALDIIYEKRMLLLYGHKKKLKFMVDAYLRKS